MELRAKNPKHKNFFMSPFIKILFCICLIGKINSSNPSGLIKAGVISSTIKDHLLPNQKEESPLKLIQADKKVNESLRKQNVSGLPIEETSIKLKLNEQRVSEYNAEESQPENLVIGNQMNKKQLEMDENQTVKNNPDTTKNKNITIGFTPMVNLESLKGRFIERGQDMDYKETYENDTTDEADTTMSQEPTYGMLIEHQLSHSFDYRETISESSTNPFNDTTSNENPYNMETTTDFENVTESVCVGQVIYCNLTKDEYIELLDDYIFPMPYEWVLIASHMVVFFVGLVGNALVCVAVYRNHSMRTVTNYFIVNLAVADFMVILFCLPPTVLWDVTETWFFGNAMCRIVLYFQVNTNFSSLRSRYNILRLE